MKKLGQAGSSARVLAVRQIQLRFVAFLIAALAATSSAAAPISTTRDIQFQGVHNFVSSFGTSGVKTDGPLSTSYAVSAEVAGASGFISSRLSLNYDSVVPLSSASATSIGFGFQDSRSSLVALVKTRTLITSSAFGINLSDDVGQQTDLADFEAWPPLFLRASDSVPFSSTQTRSNAVGVQLRSAYTYYITGNASLTGASTGSLLAVHEGGTRRTFEFQIDDPTETVQLDLGIPGRWSIRFTDVQNDFQLNYDFSIRASVEAMLLGQTLDQLDLAVDRAPLYSFDGGLTLAPGSPIAFSILVEDAANGVPAPGTLLLSFVALAGLGFSRRKRAH